jgi:hypothetical protein
MLQDPDDTAREFMARALSLGNVPLPCAPTPHDALKCIHCGKDIGDGACVVREERRASLRRIAAYLETQNKGASVQRSVLADTAEAKLRTMFEAGEFGAWSTEQIRDHVAEMNGLLDVVLGKTRGNPTGGDKLDVAQEPLFCEPDFIHHVAGTPVVCVYCRQSQGTSEPLVPPRVCPVRMAQRAALQEIAAQRAALVAARPVEGARRPPSDEMRGGLHTMGEGSGIRTPLTSDVAFDHQNSRGVLGSYGVAQMARAPGKRFTRAEILAVLRAQRGWRATWRTPSTSA